MNDSSVLCHVKFFFFFKNPFLPSFLKHLHMAWGSLETPSSNQTSEFLVEVAGIEEMALRVRSSGTSKSSGSKPNFPYKNSQFLALVHLSPIFSGTSKYSHLPMNALNILDTAPLPSRITMAQVGPRDSWVPTSIVYANFIQTHISLLDVRQGYPPELVERTPHV